MNLPDYSKIAREEVFSPVFSTSLVGMNFLSASDNSLDIYYHYSTLLMGTRLEIRLERKTYDFESWEKSYEK